MVSGVFALPLLLNAAFRYAANLPAGIIRSLSVHKNYILWMRDAFRWWRQEAFWPRGRTGAGVSAKITGKEYEYDKLAIGIPVKVYSQLTEAQIGAIESLPGVVIAVVEGPGEEEMLAELEASRKSSGAMASALIDARYVDAKDMTDIIEDLVSKVRQSLFSLSNPEIAALNEDTVKAIEDLPGLLERISANLRWSNAIKSLELSSLSVYQMRVQRSYDKFYGRPVKVSNRVEYMRDILKKKEEHYLLHFIDGEAALADKARSIIPMGMEIAKRRELMNVTREMDIKLLHDKFFVTLPANVKTEEEKLAFTKEIMKIWMLENVVDEKEDIVLLDAKEYSTSDIFKMAELSSKKVSKDNTGIRVITGVLIYDDDKLIQLALDSKATNNINQYEVFVNMVLGKAPERLLGLVPGLNNVVGRLFTYLPKIQAIDLEEEMRNYYRYVKEVLVRA